MIKALGYIFLAIIAFAMFRACGDVKDANKEIAQQKESVQKQEQNIQQGGWIAGEEQDAMRGKTTKYYQTKSLNQVIFKFPYDGGSTLSIMIIDRGNRKDVMLKISKGQLMVHDRIILAKFDDGKAERYSISPASDGSHDVAFIEDSNRFISKLKKAKTALIEAEFYNEGANQFSFDVAGLELK